MRTFATLCFCSLWMATGLLALGADDEPSFGDLIKSSSYLRSLTRKPEATTPAAPAERTPPAVRAEVEPTTAGDGALASQIDTIRALVKEKNFREAAAAVRKLQQAHPRKAQLRYYLAFIYYSAATADWDRARRKRLLETARLETFRALDLAGDTSDPRNPDWVTNAEVLLARVQGLEKRPVPPVHGCVAAPFAGSGGIQIGSVSDAEGQTVYDIAGKPVTGLSAGTVESVVRAADGTFTVRVRHSDARGEPFLAEYGRLQDAGGLKAGAQLGRGAILGHVGRGASGRPATLFLRVERDGRDFDVGRLLSGNGQKGELF